MKHLLALLFISLGLISYSQNLNGTYFENSMPGGGGFTFEKDGRFRYNASHCTYNVEGKGTYKILNDSIYFSYEKMNQPGEINISKTGDSDSTITLQILTIHYSTNKPIEGVLIKPTHKNETKKKEFTNSKGETNFSFKGNKLNCELLKSNYEQLTFQIDEPGEYEVVIKWKSGRYIISEYDKSHPITIKGQDSILIGLTEYIKRQ